MSQNLQAQNQPYLLTLQLMPKLRKHSQIKELREEPENSQPMQRGHSKQKSNSRSLLSNPFTGRKKKYRERTVLNNTIDADSNSNPKQLINHQTSFHSQDCKGDNFEIDNFVSKFKDDDEYSKDQLNTKQAKKKKQGIRVSNKFFTDQNFENELEQLPPEQLELVVERKEARNPEHLLAKVEKRAVGCKNRLDFKNVEQDHRLKQDMKHKLKSLSQFEEVNLVIEVPQVFGTNKHIDGALFLKNVKTSNKNAVVLEESVEEKEEIIKDRKVFYENLSKKMKLKKAETLTESVLKQCFKKSRLDDSDFLCDFNDNQQHGESSKFNSLRQRKFSQSQTNEKREYQNKPIAPNTQLQIVTQIEKPNVEDIKIISLKENKNDDQNDDQSQKVPTETEVQISAPSIVSKPKRSKGRRKKNKFNIKDLIEEEAEDSDQDGNVVRDRDSSQSDDNADLPQLIDDDVTICEEDQYNVHRHFIKDMLEAEQRNFAKMHKKINEQHRQHEDQLRSRMEAAAKRNASKQQKVQPSIELSCHAPSEPSDQGSSNMKNLNQLKQLQIELGISKAPASQQHSSTENQTISKKMAQFERLMNFETAQIRKPITTGLKNVQKFKSRPKIKYRIKD